MSAGRPSLRRERIVEAALALVDREGPEAFSMRRLGAELGVDPMAVYYHLPNKAALFDALVDEVWARTVVSEPPPGASWQAIVAEVIAAFRHQLLAHPRVIPILATRPVVTPRMVELVERALGWLADAGLPPASAMELLDCLVGYTIGKTQGELREPVGGTDVDPDAVYAALGPDAHPRLAAALADGYGWQPEEEFRRGLDALIRGWR